MTSYSNSLLCSVSEEQLRALVAEQLTTRNLRSVDRFTPGYVPSEKQQLFHQATGRYVLFGGAAGPGKSRAMREEALSFALNHPGSVQGLFRRTMPELRDTHILKWQQEVPRHLYRLNRTDHTVTFNNGSILIFGHCQHEDTVQKYLGTEYDRLYFDELTTFSETIFDMLCSRLRSTDPTIRVQVKAASNPGGIGHHWVRSRWIERTAEDRVDLAEYEFIPARLVDHPSADFQREYAKQLDALPEAKRRAYLDGDWYVFEGQFFGEFRNDVHVIAPFELPTDWPRLRCIDYGATAPFCCLWLCLDPAFPQTATGGRVYCYREHYAAEKSLDYHVAEILRRSYGERVRGTVADPSMFAATQEVNGGRLSLADQSRELGLVLQRANNDRLGGWELFRQLLLPRGDGLPGLLIFSTCNNLTRTIPLMVHDDRNVEDLDTKAEDHAVDTARYGLMELLGTGQAKPTAGAGRLQVAGQSRWGRGL